MVATDAAPRRQEGAILIGQPAHAWVSGQLARAWGGTKGSAALSPGKRSASRPSSMTSAWRRGMRLRSSIQPPACRTRSASFHGTRTLRSGRRRRTSFCPSRATLRCSSRFTEQGSTNRLTSPTSRTTRSRRPRLSRWPARVPGRAPHFASPDRRYAQYVLPEVLARNRRLVARWDGISLALCHGLRFEHAHEGVPSRGGRSDDHRDARRGRRDRVRRRSVALRGRRSHPPL